MWMIIFIFTWATKDEKLWHICPPGRPKKHISKVQGLNLRQKMWQQQKLKARPLAMRKEVCKKCVLCLNCLIIYSKGLPTPIIIILPPFPPFFCWWSPAPGWPTLSAPIEKSWTIRMIGVGASRAMSSRWWQIKFFFCTVDQIVQDYCNVDRGARDLIGDYGSAMKWFRQ